MAHHKVNSCKNCKHAEPYAGDFLILCKSPKLNDRFLMQACYVRNDPTKCSVDGKWFVAKELTFFQRIIDYISGN